MSQPLKARFTTKNYKREGGKEKGRKKGRQAGKKTKKPTSVLETKIKLFFWILG